VNSVNSVGHPFGFWNQTTLGLWGVKDGRKEKGLPTEGTEFNGILSRTSRSAWSGKAVNAIPNSAFSVYFDAFGIYLDHP